jgi:hypothetical protein
LGYCGSQRKPQADAWGCIANKSSGHSTVHLAMAVFRLTHYLRLLGLKLNNAKRSLMAGVLFGTYGLAGKIRGSGLGHFQLPTREPDPVSIGLGE